MHENFLRIAGITIAIRCGDPRVACRHEGTVMRFRIDPAPPDIVLDVAFLDHYEPPTGAMLFDSGGVWRSFAEGDGVRIECRWEERGAGAADAAGSSWGRIRTGWRGSIATSRGARSALPLRKPPIRSTTRS